MPSMCDTTLTIRGDPDRLDRFLTDIALDREAFTAAQAVMARLVESRVSGQLVLHRRSSADSSAAHCGSPIDSPERRWASPGWLSRDPEPAPRVCSACSAAVEEDVTHDEQNRRGLLAFRDILPPPQLDDDELREWVIENWGTKWDLSFTRSWIEDERPGTITIKLETAWGPPLPVVDAMARRAPFLTFEASWEAEPVGALDEIGEAVWRDGVQTSYSARMHD